MADPVGVLREVLTLTSDVRSLKEQVVRLEERVLNHHDRIVTLENTEEKIMLKAEISAIKGVAQLNTHLIERIVNIEKASGIKPPEIPKLSNNEYKMLP